MVPHAGSRFFGRKINRNARKRLLIAGRSMALETLEGRTLLSTVTWTGASDNIWSNPGNWAGNAIPQAGDDLVFPASPTRLTSVNTLAAGTSFASVTIQGSGYTILGNGLSLSGGISYTAGSGSADYRLDTAMGTGAVSVTAGGTLRVQSDLSGAAGLTLGGGGTLTLAGTGANTYTGGTAVNQGTLQLSKTGAVAVPGNLVVGDGAHAAFITATASDQIADSAAVTINTGGLVDLNGQSDTFASLSMTGSSVATGAGTLTLTGNITINISAGSSSISGILNLGAGSHTISVADGLSAADLDLSAIVQGAGGSILKSGAGRMVLSGNNTFSGGIEVSAGTAAVATSSSGGTGTLTIDSGATLELSNAGTTLSNALSLSGAGVSGAGAIHSVIGSNTLSGLVTLAGNASLSVDAGTLTISNVIGDGGNNYTITKTGAGTLVLSAANTYGGSTTISGGTLRISNASALGTAPVNVSGGTTLELSGGFIVANDLTVAGTLRSAAGATTESGNITLSGSSTVNVAAGTFTLSGAIGDGGNARGITKTGSGSLVLSGVNTYTGATAISAGALTVNGSISSAVSIASGASLSGTGTTGTVTSAGGSVAPGSGGPGTLNTGGLTLNASSTVSLELNGNTTGTGIGHYDQLNVSGGVNLAGATLSSTLGGAYIPAGGDALIIINNDGADPVTGTFNGLPQSSYISFGVAKNFRITYTGGDGNDVALVYVQDTTTSIAADVNPSVHGQSVTFTATVTAGVGTPTGIVTFMDGATVLGPAVLDGSGQATLSIASLSTGTHSITVSYGGDLSDAPSSSSALSQVINKASTTSALASTVNPSVFGQSTTLTATISAAAPGAGTPTGSVTFKEGATVLGTATLDGAGQASISIASLSVATHGLTVVYAGDTNFLTSTSVNMDQEVDQASTSTALSSSPNPTVFGQSTTLSATVTAAAPGAGLPTGTVDFFDGVTLLGSGALDGSGVATLSISSLATGAHNNLTAVYSGDASFLTSTSLAAAHTVNQASTTTVVAADINPSVFGQSVAFTAAVAASVPGAGTPTGNVDFFDGAVNIGTAALDGTGHATINVASLAVGTHGTITAVYAGDGDFLTSTTSNFSQTVNKAAASASLSSNHNPSVHGQNVTITVTVSPVAPGAGTPSGNVSFMEGATVLSTVALDGSGQATFSSAALSTGSHDITVSYVGDSSFLTTNASPLSQVVNQASTTISLVADNNPSAFGQSVTFTATVAATAPGAGTATGTVSFFDGATLLGTGTLNGAGQATFSTSALAVATHANITAVYGGDADFVTSTSNPYSQEVDQAATTTALASSPAPSVFGQSVALTATINAAAPGAGLPTGTVDFFDGITHLGSANVDGTGKAVLNVASLAVGAHNNLTAVYSGDASFVGSTSLAASQTVNQSNSSIALDSDVDPAAFGQTIHLTATVSATAPGAGTPTGTVDFFDGVTNLGTANLVAGVATLPVNSLAVGVHNNLSAVYNGDANFNTVTSSTSTVTVTQDAADISLSASANPTVYGQPTTLTATVTAAAPGSGTPTGSVDFYDGTTLLGSANLNGAGQAAVVIASLPPGSHNFSASYSGDADFGATDSNSLNATVSSASTDATLASSANPTVFGQSTDLTITVAPTPPGVGTPTGSVTLLDGATQIGSANLVNGSATISLASLAVGSHSLTITYAGDTNFGPSTSNLVTQVVNQASTTTAVVSNHNPSVWGQSVTFTATVAATAPGTGTATGTVSFFDGATLLGTGTLNGAGQATFSTSALAVATHANITAVYAGDASFTGSTSNPLSQEVDQSATSTALVTNTNPAVFGQNIAFTATVTATAPGAGTPTGTVDFFDNAVNIGTVNLDANGQAVLHISNFNLGNHPITAVYNADANFTGSTSNVVNQAVHPDSTTTTLLAAPNPSIYGQSITFTATVAAAAPGAGVPTGHIQFLVDGNPLGGQILLDGSGQASISTSALAAGPHNIVAFYDGDPTFLLSTNSPFSQTVNKASTSASLSADINPSTFGQSVTLTATITAVAPGAGTPTGNVTFKDGTTVLGTVALDGAGQASLSTSALAAGSHNITVDYAGDSNFDIASSAPAGQTVNQSATTTTLASNHNPSVAGQLVTFTATIAATAPGAGTATGTVSFFDGATLLGTGTLDGAGQATFTTSALAVATHANVTAVYAGDANFTTSTSNPLSQVVNADTTTTGLLIAPNPSVFGQSIVLAAAVTADAPGGGIPTGTVDFFDGATLLGSASLDNAGTAALSIASLAVGAHNNITAVYNGDGSYAGSASVDVQQTVNQASTTVGVASDINPSVFGQSINLTATVSASAPGTGTPTGTVDFFDNGNPIGSANLVAGHATLTTSALALGDHPTITATYSGDASFLTSTSGNFDQTVSRDFANVALGASTNPSVFGQGTTLTATVTAIAPGAGTPTGTVEFFDGSTSLGTVTLDVGGVAELLVSDLEAGTHSITAHYSGDANFSEADANPVDQVVNAAATTTALSTTSTPTIHGQQVTFTATVTANAPGAGTPSGTVNFLDGVTLLGSAALDNTGVASFDISSLSAASHSITAVYIGVADFATSASNVVTQDVTPADTTTTVLADANPAHFGQPITFTATITPVAPGAGTPTGSIDFFDGPTLLGSAAVDNTGHASLTLANLGLGSHTITAAYNGDTDFNNSSSNQLSQDVVPTSTTASVSPDNNPSVVGQNLTLTATIAPVAPGAGIPTGNVTFLDGVTVLGTVALDGSGQASLVISDLALGTHSITVNYAGDAHYLGSVSNALSQQVTKADTSLAIDAQPTSAAFGQNVTLTATLTMITPNVPLPAGSVSFFDDGTLLGTAQLDNAGVATLVVNNLPVGQHANLTAQYVGDSTYNGSLAFAQQPVTITDNIPTSTGIADVSVSEDAANTQVDLSTSFGDLEDGAASLTYAITANDNAGLFASASITGHTLTLGYAPDANGIAHLTIRATDSANQSVTSSFTVTVSAVNDAPGFTLAGGDQSASEDAPAQSIPNFITGITAGPANESSQTVHFVVTVDDSTDDNLFSVAPAVDSSGTLTYTVAPGHFGSASLSIHAVDDGGTASGGVDTSDDQTFSTTVNGNPDAPNFSVSHAPGTAVEIDALAQASDPEDDTLTLAIGSQPANGTVTINDQGTLDASDDTFIYTPAAGFYGSDSFTYVVSDGNGGSATGTITINPSAGASLAINPLNHSQQDLVINGTSGSDTIKLTATGASVKVVLNGQNMGTFTPTGRVIVLGGDGNDTISASKLKKRAFFYGGDGNDKLTGSTGQVMLLGGAGNDTLKGGTGRSILVGGAGKDHLTAAGTGDILIPGTLSFDDDSLIGRAALSDLLTAWSKNTSLSSRTAALKAGVGGSAAKLIKATVHNDSAQDILTGSANADWVFARKTSSTKDVLKSITDADIVTKI